MTTGVRVIWPDTGRKIDELEYFYGIDVADLGRIPDFNTVQAFWPGYKGGTMVEYLIEVRCVRNGPNEVRLEVTYRKANQTPEFLENYRDLDFCWGKNTIVLRQGEQNGRCEWLRERAKNWETLEWEAFGSAPRPLGARYRGSRREARFREMILACDDHRCVLTGEATTKALDAAHLIPAAMGENDVPRNGITLRADLHRLFDSGLFTLAPDGKVVEVNPELSRAYCRDLRNVCLRASTLARVRKTLALPEFPEPTLRPVSAGPGEVLEGRKGAPGHPPSPAPSLPAQRMAHAPRAQVMWRSGRGFTASPSGPGHGPRDSTGCFSRALTRAGAAERPCIDVPGLPGRFCSRTGGAFSGRRRSVGSRAGWSMRNLPGMGRVHSGSFPAHSAAGGSGRGSPLAFLVEQVSGWVRMWVREIRPIPAAKSKGFEWDSSAPRPTRGYRPRTNHASASSGIWTHSPSGAGSWWSPPLRRRPWGHGTRGASESASSLRRSAGKSTRCW